jgi:hypothetical protein
LEKLLDSNKLDIPDPRFLPSDAEELSMSFVLVGDEAQYINIISMIPNNINKKINVSFFSDFCSAGSSLQFVTTDL